MSRTLLLDTSSLAYRAFFALPPTITDPAGAAVNAVYGYLDMTAQLVRGHAPDQLVHCIDDDWRPAPRVAAYAGYKAERPPDPEALPDQFDVLDEVLDALGMTRSRAVGWEADDVIGTRCATATAPTDVVTGDRDLLQLVHDDEPAVRVLFTVKGVRDLAVFDAGAVERKYGVSPQRYADFAILRGDPSDGLPGVKGIGEKTARDLIHRHGSLDGVLAATASFTPSLRTRLREATDYLDAMRSVVPVRLDAQLTDHRSDRDDERVDALGERHALAGPLRRLREAMDAG